MKRLILLIYLAVVCNPLYAAERPTIAILPFGEVKDRSQVKYLGLATAATLAEKLRRVPSVRVLPLSIIIRELRTAGIDPYEVSWTPAVATEPLGQWLDADILIIGAIGQTRDRKIADVILQVSEDIPSAKNAQIWLAARAVDIHTGETLRRAYVEGRHEGLFALQHDLLAHIGDLLGIRDHLSLDVVQRPPTNNVKAYKQVAGVERLIMDLDQIEDKKRENQIKKASKRLKSARDQDPEFAFAHTWQGALLALQNQNQAAAEAFETAAKFDPHLSAPYYGLADLALQRQDMAGATTALDQLLEITPWDDEAHRLQGKIQQILGNQTQALAAYERAINLYPRQHTTHYAVGKIYIVQKEPRKAIDALQKAVDVVPGNLVYQIALADAHLAANNLNRAKEVLESISSFAQNDPEFVFVRGKHALKTDRLADAITDFKEALIVLDERADVHAALGTAYIKQSRFSDAIGAFVDAQSHGAPLPDIAIPFGSALEAQEQMTEAEDLYQQALNRAPSRSDLRLRLVKNMIIRKKNNAALETLRTGIQIDPNNGNMHILLGDLYAAKQMHPEAIRHYERAIEVGHDAPDLAARLGDLLLSQNHPERARTHYKKALEAGIIDASVYAGLGTAEESLGNHRAALAAYQQALKANPQHDNARQGAVRMAQTLRPKQKTPNHEDHARQGQQALAMGDLNRAKEAMKRATALAPANATYWNDLGTVYAQLNDLAAAEAAFHKATQHAPETPEPIYNLCRLYADTHRLNDAEAACHEALSIDATYLPARQQLGAVYLAMGHLERAHTTLQNALEQDPNNAELHLVMGNVLFMMQNLEAATVAYQTARNQGLSAATVGLGAIQLARGDTTQAINHFQMAADRNNPAGYVNLGAIHTVQGDYETAISNFQQALDLDPTEAGALFGLAALYYKAGQYTDALDICNTLQERHPNSAEANQLTGTIAYTATQYELALIAYRAAANLNENNAETHKGLALTYEALDDPESAHKHWERWLELVGDNPEMIEDINRVTEHLKTLAKLSAIAPNVNVGLP